MIGSIVKQDGFLSRKTDDDIWGKGVQEGWMCFKEGNLRSIRVGHPHVLKGGLVGKKTILDQQRVLNGMQGERETFSPLEKGISSSEGDVRPCGEKMKRTKARLNLSIAIEDNK